MVLTYLECALQDKEFEYFWKSVQPFVQNLKILHAAKRPKAVSLDIRVNIVLTVNISVNYRVLYRSMKAVVTFIN